MSEGNGCAHTHTTNRVEGGYLVARCDACGAERSRSKNEDEEDDDD